MNHIHYSIVNNEIASEKVERIDYNTLLFSYPCDSLYTCSPYKVILSRGVFQIECYGAGNKFNSYSAGGGYTSGIIKIPHSLILYLYLGSEGLRMSTPINNEVFNGGGGNITASHTGSGATDVRLEYGEWKDFSSLKSRIMVAGGAGGSECGNGGVGGGINGGNGGPGYCAQGYHTQLGYGASNVAGGNGTYEGKFGYAQPVTGNNTNNGGGGYYGGGSCFDHGAGAGGGSSFISGHPNCDAISADSTETSIIHTHQSIHYSNISFFSTVILSGDEDFISPNRNGVEKGHISSGNVVITFISQLSCGSHCQESFLSIVMFLIFVLYHT